jgi:hypothetical protein
MFLNEFKGLNLQANSFKSLEGYFEVAENILVSRDNIVQKINGYSTFLAAPNPSPLALADYKNKLVLIGANYINILNQNAGGDYVSTLALVGQTFTVSYPRNVQAGGNLFTTTDNFVLKMESASAPLLQAGVPKAPDLTYLPLGGGTVSDAVAGIHAPDSQVGYRIIFGRKDLNSNTVLGAPSELTLNTNPMLASTSIALSTYDVTVEYTAHGLLVNDFVTIRASNGINPVPDGEYTVTAVPDANHFTFSTVAVLTTVPDSVTDLKFGIRRKPTLEFTVPTGVNTTFFYRVYRTNASISNDVEPDESTLQLINEQNVSAAEVTAGYIQFTDTIDDLFKTTYLYTNPNTGEGISEANYQPPVALDIALFKNHMFFSYPTTFYSMRLALIRSSASTFANGDYVDVVQVDRSRTATAATWQSGTTVRYSVSSITNLQAGQYVNYTGFVNSANNGKFIITAVGVNYVDCTNAGRTSATGNETLVTAAAFPVRRYTAASTASYNTAAGGNFKLMTSSLSVSFNIDATARSLCTTINRDHSSNAYCSYTSSSQTLPGQMFMYSRIITDSFAVQASSSTVGANFDPTLPTANTDLSVSATNNVYPNGLYISKPSEFEAVPLTSFILIGSKDAAIQRIAPLKNSLIIFKEDGIFSLRGDSRSDFSVVPLDTSVFCNAIESVQEINGNLYAMTLSGVVQVSETNVAIVSRDIEPLLTAVFTDADFSNNTYATSLDGSRLYAVTTITPNDGASTTYIYDVITNVWTTSTRLYKQGIIKRSDNVHYAIDSAEQIRKMRKLNNKLDYCDENLQVSSISDVSADERQCFAISPLVIEKGDVFVFDNSINRIEDVLIDGTLVFRTTINFTAADRPQHYKRIVSRLTFSPIGGNEDTLYQYQEMSVNFRNQACTTMDIGFVSDAGDVPPQPWESQALFGGWGDLPWGNFEWGLTETTEIDLKTYSSEPVRIFIPLDCQISTWLQVKLEHYQAA